MPTLFSPADRRLAALIGKLGFANPFLATRIELEREILGDQFTAGEPVWSVDHVGGPALANLERISTAAAKVVDRAQGKLAAGLKTSENDAELYADAALYHLFDEFRFDFQELVETAHNDRSGSPADLWKRFRAAVDKYLRPSGRALPIVYDDAHLFASFFQLRRAFFHVFFFIVGRSSAAARLRASVWESIFTHNLRRYQRTLWRHMDDVTTLITGPSGTGKELVARAVGFSRYIPFDEKRGEFAQPFAELFQPVNLSALSPTLIESELFGHRRGSFTGAVDDRVGWLEGCRPHGAVFLDEIGELDPVIQVKMLRVLQSRSFQRLGDTAELQFAGKIIAATNRDLFEEIRAGRFREDFYYRLCADRIETPSLREQLNDCPADLEHLLMFIAGRVAPEDAQTLAAEVAAWIDAHLGAQYPWPGNFRELEQCFRNIMIHGDYRAAHVSDEKPNATAAAAAAGQVSADELLQLYCKQIYAECGSYEGTAKRIGLDRRTVKRKIEAVEVARR